MREQNTYINLLHDNLNWEKNPKNKWSSNWIKDSDMFIQWHTPTSMKDKENIDKSQKYYTK